MRIAQYIDKCYLSKSTTSAASFIFCFDFSTKEWHFVSRDPIYDNFEKLQELITQALLEKINQERG